MARPEGAQPRARQDEGDRVRRDRPRAAPARRRPRAAGAVHARPRGPHQEPREPPRAGAGDPPPRELSCRGPGRHLWHQQAHHLPRCAGVVRGGRAGGGAEPPTGAAAGL